MFEYIPLAAAAIGSVIAATWDLKTTEIPNGIPYVMMAVGLAFWSVQSLLTGNYMLLAVSMISGLSLLGFGFIMYNFGQWGGGDALVLSAIGFLLPVVPAGFSHTFFPYPVSYLFNVFIIGAGYMLVYAFVLALLNRKVFSDFISELKAGSRMILMVLASLIIIFSVVTLYISNLLQIPLDNLLFVSIVLPSLMIIGLYVVFKFARSVESVAFRQRIPVSRLRVGDVLMDSKVWEGLNEKQLAKVKKSGKRFVWIKTGVRFGPAFPLALLFTLYFGDLIFLLTTGI